ncbi:hypothetical protein [Kitasatospora sp. NPDC092286]|uniref:hypothetical protein n=1 Tax=Kitasatospora sp. NPDC092286 TaxID=3364087 RepID=UPI0037F13FC2
MRGTAGSTGCPFRRRTLPGRTWPWGSGANAVVHHNGMTRSTDLGGLPLEPRHQPPHCLVTVRRA